MRMDDLKKTSKAERLRAMEAVRDSLLRKNRETEAPEWHEKVLEKRKKRIESGTASFISLSELKARCSSG